jgi:SAM-dependent methyltransferase
MAIPIMAPIMLLHSILMATPIRSTLISMFIPFVMQEVETEFHQERQTLLENTITTDCIVLDLGSGGGAYLRYCTKAKQVFAVEPVEKLHPKIKKAGEHLQNLIILKDISEIDESIKFNVIILGNVLCEVPNVPEILKQVDRRLVANGSGKVYFSEHIARPAGTWQRHFQNCVNPMWRHLSGGCNCNRDSLHYIQTVNQDWQVIYWSYPHHSVNLGPFVLGLALKTKTEA